MFRSLVGAHSHRYCLREEGGCEKEKEVKPVSSTQPAWRAKGTSRTEKHGLMSFCDFYSSYCPTFNTEELSFKVWEAYLSYLFSWRMQAETENVGRTAEGWFDKYSSAVVVLKQYNVQYLYLISDLTLGFNPPMCTCTIYISIKIE